jgi:DNA-binding beta-propeller fold protein YncE
VISIGQYRSPSYGILNSQGGLAFDSSGRLWIADTYNNRVLGFAAPFSNDMTASFVLGQTDLKGTKAGISAAELNYPMDVAFDRNGNLWVADIGNSRVVAFEPPFHNGMTASLVIGQPDFLSRWFNIARNRLDGPYGIAFDGFGNLWVADSGNNRVLEFDPPFATGMNASLVIGESDFISACVQPTCPSRTTLFGPWRVAFDPSGDLWVGEGYASTHRLLEFKPIFKNGMEASTVIQPNPTYGEPSGLGLGLTFDSIGNLWIGYWGESPQGGVFEFRPPFDDRMNATVRLAGYPGSSESQDLSAPTGLAFDSSGNLWVADWGSSWGVSLVGRILAFDAQVHVVNTPAGRVYFRNYGGLLAPLSSIPLTQVEPLMFPQGLFNFTIQGLPARSRVTLTISFSQPLAPQIAWWSKNTAEWSPLPANQTHINGNNITLTLADATPNGVISVLGGPAMAPVNITAYTENTAIITSELQNPPAALLAPALVAIAALVTVALAAVYWRHWRKP